MSKFFTRISTIQVKLKALKDMENKFGGYNYRNAESILSAVKPHLDGLVINLTDEVECIGDRYYIKATATLTDGESSIHSVAYAREALSKKGMDDAQLSGSCSSYARKYALSGLLALDSNPDSDDPDQSKANQEQEIDELIEQINSCTAQSDLVKINNQYRPKQGEEASTEDQKWYTGLPKKQQDQISKAIQNTQAALKEAKA